MAAAAPLTPTERFFAPEITKVIYIPTLAGASLTRPDIDAGTDLTDEIAEISGFSTSGATIDTPDLGHRFISKIAARVSSADSSITFYASLDGEDVRGVLPRLTKGYLLFADQGDALDLPADLFKIEVTSMGKVRTTGDNAFQITVSFAITAVPVEDLPLPAPSV